MTFRRFQVSKYRNSAGAPLHRQEWYQDVPFPIAAGTESSNGISVSPEYAAVKWAAGGSGVLGLLPLETKAETPTRSLKVHSSGLTDWSFSEFDPSLVVSGHEDGIIKAWKLGETDEQNSEKTSVSGGTWRIEALQLHPTTSNILATSSQKEIKVWDIEAFSSDAVFTLAGHGDLIYSISWRQNGILLASVSKDKTVKLWDPRQGQDSVQSASGHQGLKTSRIHWLGNTPFVLTTGFSKMRERQYALWDSRNMDKPLKMSMVDLSNGVLMPFYDQDTRLIYLVGKGDSSIRSLELEEFNQTPTLTELTPTGTSVSQIGAGLVPKVSLDVMQAEIARMLVVTENAVVPVSYKVPRKHFLDFHADLYPDTKSSVPAQSSKEWLAGQDNLVSLTSLDPSKRSKQSNLDARNQSEQSFGPAPATANKSSSDTLRSTPSVTKLDGAVQSLSVDEGEDTSSKPTPTYAPLPETKNVTNESMPETSKDGIEEETVQVSPERVAAIQARFANKGQSHFKYVSGKPFHPSKHFDDLRALSQSKAGDFDLIQCNPKFIAVALDGPGGRVGIINAQRPARLPIKIPAVVCGSTVVDFKWNPFNMNELVTAGADGSIKRWTIPDGGLEEDLLDASGVLKDSKMDKISLVLFHPLASDLLLSVSADRGVNSIRIFDLKQNECKVHLKGQHKDAISSVAWSPDGKLIATSSKDKRIRLIDPRANKVVGEAAGHDSVRPSRVLWLGNSGFLVSIGFNRASYREIILYDSNDMAACQVAKRNIDISPSTMVPSYDEDTGILFLAGRGDRIIHTFEFARKAEGSPPVIDALPKFEFSSLHQGFAFLPKRVCDVRQVEIARFYRLIANKIEPVGVYVPRSRMEFFQDDIFLPSRVVDEPAIAAKDWLDGHDAEPRYVDLAPADMTPCKLQFEMIGQLIKLVPVSKAPPPPVTVAKKKFEIGKKQVSDEEQQKNIMNKMFATAKALDSDEQEEEKPRDDDSDDDWD
ncbi:hypothetical protein BZG36_01201 [Bifiguratus adelaidae]|uniref:Coronin n=1 Tax=Bifiguratus adelaidae TaxID=1938954 RepID=A0A261Y605_9FUNG|nr:hypothetical protein BZG36_01201 [Bifiguratus adelaidae]